MDNSDLQNAIEIVRDSLFTDEEETQLQRIIDRLEGYELAYGVLLKKVERLSSEAVPEEFQRKIVNEINSLRTENQHGSFDYESWSHKRECDRLTYFLGEMDYFKNKFKS